MTPRQENTIETQEQEVPDESRWKLDRHIPIAFLIGLLLQTGGIVWWASALSEQVDQATTINASQDAEIGAIQAAQAARDVATATAAAELRAVRDSIGEIKSTLADQNQLLRQILTNGGAKP